MVDNLAIDAGCFVALHELAMHPEEGADLVLDELASLPLCIRNGLNTLGSLSWYRFGYRQRVSTHALQRIFPVSSELTNDKDRAEWVRGTRRRWISGDISTDNPLLTQVKIVIQNTDENDASG